MIFEFGREAWEQVPYRRLTQAGRLLWVGFIAALVMLALAILIPSQWGFG